MFVLKYFENSEHGMLHFKAESNFLVVNQGAGFIPKLIWKDETRGSFASQYIEQDKNNLPQVVDLINEMTSKFNILKVPFAAHEGPSGILSWWKNSYQFPATAQNLILETARNLVWFKPASESVAANWKNEGVIHGDMKLQNIIISKAGLFILDWENASLGPIEWDVAGLLQSVIVETVQANEFGPWAASQVREAVAYMKISSRNLLETVALRLVQSAIELSAGADLVSVQAANCLQLADFIARECWAEIDGVFENV